MARNSVEAAFLALLSAIEVESENLGSVIRERISQADLAAAQEYQNRLKKLLSFRSNLIKAHRKWIEE